VAVGGGRRGPLRRPWLDKVAPRSYLRPMRAVGLKVLKNRLSEYVRLAATGETVLVTDRDRVVAELGPPRESRSPLLADARLAEAVRRGWITPPAMPGAEPPPRRRLDHPARDARCRASPAPASDEAAPASQRTGPGPRRSVIYLDSSVALAHLLAEDRVPPQRLWGEPLTSSRLLEYEVWTRIHGRRLAGSHGESVRALIGRVALVELAPP